jgi:NADPH:quinone reductase and related Zn-dependent oxidoreductases
VYGTTGSIGSASVQLLKYFGATVTAVCNTQNVELVKSLGADYVIDYTKEDFTKTDKTFDFVFDAVGKSSFGQCKPLLKQKGIYIYTELGKRAENVFFAIFTPIFGSKKVLFPIPTITQQDVDLLKKMAETGKFKPVVDRTYSLDKIVEAHKYVDTGHKIGNVVILI